jgi:hypothetical protein
MRSFLYRGLALAGLALLLQATSGCRHYQRGSLAHPQLKSIAIGDVENRTQEPALGPVLKQKLPARFMTDGSLQVLPRDEADAVVITRILAVELRGKGSNQVETGDTAQRIYRSSIFGARVRVAYRVIAARNGAPLLAEQIVEGNASFTVEIDPTVTREKALATALADAADNVVTGVTEAW